MASLESIAIRKTEAQERVSVAVKRIAKATKLGTEIDLAPIHKDVAIQGAIQVEALADYLEALAAHLTKPAEPVLIEPEKAADKPKGTDKK